MSTDSKRMTIEELRQLLNPAPDGWPPNVAERVALAALDALAEFREWAQREPYLPGVESAADELERRLLEAAK